MKIRSELLKKEQIVISFWRVSETQQKYANVCQTFFNLAPEMPLCANLIHHTTLYMALVTCFVYKFLRLNSLLDFQQLQYVLEVSTFRGYACNTVHDTG